MAKVLWIQNIWIEFYGVMSISAILKKNGHQSIMVMADSEKEILSHIHRHNPDVIGFSCMSIQWKWAKTMSTFIKRNNIKTPIILGGIHATMFPHDAIKHPDIDVVCLYEGESAMLEFMNALDHNNDCAAIKNLWVRKKDGLIVKNLVRPKMTQEEIDSLPFADRDLYKSYQHFQNYPFEIFMGSRGCPFQCSFCEMPQINRMYGGKAVQYRDPVKFVDEIEAVKKRGFLNGKLAMFSDSTFNSHRAWFLKFLEEYRKRVHVPFSCNLRVDLVDEAQVQAMAESGCDNVRFGVEAGDPDIRNKILNKHLSDEQIEKVAGLLHKYKIPFVTFNLFASPGETYEQAWKTIRLNRKIRPSAVGAYVFVLFPGINATNYAIEKNLIEESDLDMLEKPPYNIHLSLLALHPERSKDIIKICNLQKFAILLVRLPFLEPLIRLLVKLPAYGIFGAFYSVCQVWEWRKWSTKTTFRRLLYEAILNYQALIETGDSQEGLLKKISLWVAKRTKSKQL